MHCIYLDTDEIEGLAERIDAQEEVLVIRIYDENGRVLAAPDDAQLEASLNIDPFGAELVASDGLQFQRRSDRLVAGQPVIVARRVLGAVHVELSTAPLDAKVAERT